MAPKTPINVLLIEDNPTDVRLVREILRGTPNDDFTIISASTLAQGLAHLAADHVDVILLDLGLPDSQGFDTFQAVEERASDLPIIILTISANEELGLSAIRAGAQRVFSKDVLTPDGAYAEMFPHVIHYAIEHKRVETELQQQDEKVRRLNNELESKTEELRIANEALEQRVEERTAELAAATASLKESEARYRRLVEKSFDAVLIHSDGVIRLANQAAARILKATSPQTLAGMNILDLPAPRYRELAKERISAVYKTKQSSQPVEFQYCALDGTIVEVEAMATSITYEDKPAVYVVFRDIGDRKRSEEQVRAASLYARSLIEASLDPLVTISAKGRITDVNTATEEATGCSRDELIGSDFSDYFTEPEKARAGYKKVFTDGFVRAYQLAIRHKSGSVVDVLYNATVYRNEAGEVQGVFAAARDITDLKRAEEKLQGYSSHLQALIAERTAELAQSEEYFRTLFEESAIAQIRYDVAGHPVRVNKAATTLLGIRDAGDIEHLSIWSSARVSDKDKARLRAGKPVQYERAYDFQAIRHENHFPTTRSDVRYVDFYLLPLFSASGNGVEGYLGQLVDITERKEVEAALQDSERLAAIGQTATMIGHDLRNPLQALQLIVDLAGKYYDDLSPEAKAGFDSATATRIFSSVQKQIQYMDKIVSDLQDYARPLQVEPEDVHLTAFVTDTLSLLTVPDSVSVRVDIPGFVMARVDPHLMQRALSNLVMNAVQAMPSGGELTISASGGDNAVVITVHDTGEGVPDNMKETLFSPLTTGKAKGTGLGLAVVKRIVEAHNGTIAFESEKEKGTTFTVTLPQTAE